jgi:hypothetical protein
MRRALLGGIAFLGSVSAAFGCGTDRWPVKVGSNRDAGKVANLPQPTTIAELISIAAPARPNSRRSSRFAPTELTSFQITCTLKVIKKETDEDYHLVIADTADPGVTMIVEAPEPRCALGSQFLDNIGFVRQTLDKKFGDIVRLEPNLPVTVRASRFSIPYTARKALRRTALSCTRACNRLSVMWSRGNKE